MMGDIGALVVRNDLGLDPEKVKELSRLVQKGGVSYLSPELEGIPYMLFHTGSSLQEISLKTNYPESIIILTAIRYNWPAKAEEMKKSMTDGDLTSIMADISKMLLIATHASMQKELAAILSGKGDAKHSQLIPKNVKGLKDLFDMITGLQPKSEQSGGISIPGQGNQIQINISSGGPLGKELDSLNIPKSKIDVADFD